MESGMLAGDMLTGPSRHLCIEDEDGRRCDVMMTSLMCNLMPMCWILKVASCWQLTQRKTATKTVSNLGRRGRLGAPC